MNKAQELMIESFALTSVEEPVNSIQDVKLGDMVAFKKEDSDAQLRGLPGQVRNIRNDMLDIYVGSSLRADVAPNRVVKLVKKPSQG